MGGGGKLPGLKPREVDRLLAHFAPGHTRKGDLVKGTARAGSFTIHLDHGGGLTQQQLNRVLRYLGVPRAEFLVWWDSQ